MPSGTQWQRHRAACTISVADLALCVCDSHRHGVWPGPGAGPYVTGTRVNMENYSYQLSTKWPWAGC